MEMDNRKVIMFAIITGIEFIFNPYPHHRETPNIKNINITSETSSADFDFYVFITWGKKATVVKLPARNPNMSVELSIRIINSYVRLESIGI